MKKILAILMVCMMYTCSVEASWWTSFTTSCSAAVSSILNRKIEIKGVKAPIAGIVAGVSILCGLGYAGYCYYQNWKSHQIKDHKNLQALFDGCDRSFHPQPYAQSLVCPVISPGVIQEIPNGLFVMPSLQQVFDTLNAGWKTSRVDGLAPVRCAGMPWGMIQEEGESTYCGYHALFAAQQMLQAFDASVEKNNNKIYSALYDLTQLNPYLLCLQRWVPAVRDKRAVLGENSLCSWLTSDEFSGNEAAGFAGLVSMVDSQRIIACDSFKNTFDVDGANSINFLEKRRNFAEKDSAVMSIILPATALSQVREGQVDLDATRQTHWVNFTVMKLQGQLKIFFADSLNDQRHVTLQVRDEIYEKLKAVFSMTVDDIVQLERDIISHAIDVATERTASDIKKVFPDEHHKYTFAGFVQTEPMELYEFDKLDAISEAYFFAEELGVGQEYFTAHCSEAIISQLKSFLHSRFVPVRQFRDSVEGALRETFDSEGYDACLPVVFGAGSVMRPRPRLIILWKNAIDPLKYMFIVRDAFATDREAQDYCMEKYKNFELQINGVDRILPVDKIKLLHDLYDRIIGEQGWVELRGERHFFRDLEWTPKLCQAALHLIAQTWLYLDPVICEGLDRVFADRSVVDASAGSAASAGGSSVAGLNFDSYGIEDSEVVHLLDGVRRLVDLLATKLTDSLRADPSVRDNITLCINAFYSLEHFYGIYEDKTLTGLPHRRWIQDVFQPQKGV